jgi:endonuclease YncB( thermonuclease family)
MKGGLRIMSAARGGNWVGLLHYGLALCLCDLAIAALPAAAQPAAVAACHGLVPGPARTVARVIDGETLALDDGAELRLIGALAPRALDAGAAPGTWPLEIAAAEELRALVLGSSVELAFGGERSDRYGRLQAHAIVRDGDRRLWVQGHLIAQGLARAYAQAGNRACADALAAAEREAREARRGLWADAAYQVKSGERPSELARYRGTFQLVEGRIERVAQGRGGTVYLNFEKDWRRAFAISCRRGDREALGPDAAGDAKALEGRLVRVRGWVEQQRHGPTIDLSTAGLVELLDAPVSSPAGGSRRRATIPDGQPSREPESKPPGLVEAGR